MATDVEVRATTKFQNTAGRNRKDTYRIFTFPCYTYIMLYVYNIYICIYTHTGGGGGGERYIVYGGGQMYICGLFLKLFFYQLCSFYWPKYTLPSVQADSIAGPRMPHTTHYIKYIIICIAIFFYLL